MERHRAVVLAALLLALTAAAGCLGDGGGGSTQTAGSADGADGGAGSDGGSGTNATAGSADGNRTFPTVKRTVVAEDILPHQPPQNYTYDVEGSDDKTIEVPVNSTVKLTLVSHARNALDHDIKIKGLVESEVIGPGESLTVTFNVTEPGPKPYWCTIGDHRERGMEGVLLVTRG